MKPEMTVRQLAHSLGYRYRLHRKDLPGKPDLVFGPRKAVIFVHGCFWHQHDKEDCLDGRRPKSNTDYWNKKLARNVQRDEEAQKNLQDQGWRVMVIWECETKDQATLRSRLKAFLG